MTLRRRDIVTVVPRRGDASGAAGRGVCGATAATGADVRGYHTDLGVESQVVENFKAIEKDFGQIDCLVNNAMIHDPEELVDVTLEKWNRSLAITLTASFLTIRAVLPGMIKQGTGNIINIGTVNPVSNEVPLGHELKT